MRFFEEQEKLVLSVVAVLRIEVHRKTPINSCCWTNQATTIKSPKINASNLVKAWTHQPPWQRVVFFYWQRPAQIGACVYFPFNRLWAVCWNQYATILFAPVCVDKTEKREWRLGDIWPPSLFLCRYNECRRRGENSIGHRSKSESAAPFDLRPISVYREAFLSAV